MNILWICVALVSLAIEILTPSALVIIWCFFGALVALLLSLFNISVVIQIVVFAVVSVVMMITIRPVATRYLRGNTIATNADRVIGEIGVVSKEIKEDEWGEVYVQAHYWSAVEVDRKCIEKGKKVKIMAIEGAKLIVKEI